MKTWIKKRIDFLAKSTPLTVACLVSTILQADVSLDGLRWYLLPREQIVEVDVDDINSEKLKVSSRLNWGFEQIRLTPPQKMVRIAIIDSGVDPEHEVLKPFMDFSDRECLPDHIIPPRPETDLDQNGYNGDCLGYNFVENNNRSDDPQGHGTHVGGIIATILRGYPSHFRLLPIRAIEEGSAQRAPASTIATRFEKAIRYATQKRVDIIQLSSGWPKDIMRPSLDAAIDEALASGISIVAAAGNSSQQNVPWPCRKVGVICVGALRANGEPTRFTNYGNAIDLFMPGEKILSSIPTFVTPLGLTRKGYDFKNGTSQAAPMVSAQLAYLRSTLTELTGSEIESLLMKSATSLKFLGSGYGVPNLREAMSSSRSSFALPQTKTLDLIVQNQNVDISIPFVNRFSRPTDPETVSLECLGQRRLTQPIPELASGQSHVANFSLRIETDLVRAGVTEVECLLSTQKVRRSLSLRLAKNFPPPIEEHRFDSDRVVVFTRPIIGAAGNLVTIPSLDPLGRTPTLPVYEVVTREGSTVVGVDFRSVSVPQRERCRRLRFFQFDSDPDPGYQLAFMRESLCNDDHLEYDFYKSSMEPLYGRAAVYRPDLVNINYSDLVIRPQKGAPPIFEFINDGLLPEPDSPWISPTPMMPHFYRVKAELKEGVLTYIAHSLDQTSTWVKDLGYRYTPRFQILHRLGERLLARVDAKTFWIDLKTQHAKWAPEMDIYFWGGAQVQNVSGSSETVIQILISAFDYRGLILPRTTIYHKNTDLRDPIVSVLGTEKSRDGEYTTYLQTLYNMLILKGETTKKYPIDRFDFVGIPRQIASVYNLDHRGRRFQVVDGSRLVSQHVTVFNQGVPVRYVLPLNCVPQAPLSYKERLIMPLLCSEGDRPLLKMTPIDGAP